MNLKSAMDLVFKEVESRNDLYFEDLVSLADIYLEKKAGGYSEPFGMYLYQHLFFNKE